MTVFLGVDALCHLMCGDQKAIGGLYAVTKKVATNIQALHDAGASPASAEFSVLCRWWASLPTPAPHGTCPALAADQAPFSYTVVYGEV